MILFDVSTPMVGGSLCTPASSTTKSGHHDIAEILLINDIDHFTD
jgi:hypothetical protein